MQYRNQNQEDVDHDGIDYDPPHGPGANVLCADNAVKWAPKQKPHTHWRSFGEFQYVKWWGCNWRWGYVPNPRMDEDVDYASDAYLADLADGAWDQDGGGGDIRGPYDGDLNDLKTALVTDDFDDIYSDEAQWGPSPDGEPAGSFFPANMGSITYGSWGSGWMAQWPGWSFDPWSFGGDPGPGVMGPWLDNKGMFRYFQWAPCEITPREECGMGIVWYPQRGIYATEPRWNKHDSRCITGPPWKSEFGLQGYSMYDAFAGANDPVPGED